MNIGGNQSQDEHGARPQYSMPGILHFLQTEWARFEMERAQWEVERAELQARIAFLQGERKGQENLKQDLVRRIKMLEYALKQERAKYHKLKFGTELNQGDMKPPVFEKDEKEESMDNESLNMQNSNVTWKQGRQLLRQYLQEIGYTDTIIDVRSARVRQMLGLQPLHDNDGNQQQVMNGGEPGNKRPSTDPQGRRLAKKTPPSLSDRVLTETEEAVNSTFSFLNDHLVDDEDDENLSDGENEEDDIDKRCSKKLIGNESMMGMADMMADPEADEALNELDEFLASEGGEGAGEARSGADGSEWEKKDLSPSEEWGGVDAQLISKLKDQYRKERQKGPKRSDLKAMLENLGNNGEVAGPGSARSNNNATANNDLEEGEEKRLGLDEDGLEAAIDMGDLVGLTINNEADISYDMAATKEPFRKTWNAKYTLRSHFDGVRALAFHPVEPVLITASEDHTLKLWNLQKTVQAKKTASLDVEPVYTFRGHQGSVLCLAMSPTGESCYSGGADATIRSWNIPNSNIDPYDSFDPSVVADTMVAHTDAVWGLSIHSSKTQLLSCSADGTVRLWSPGTKSPLLNTFRIEEDEGVPTSVDFVRCDPNQMVVSYTSSNAYVFDIETNTVVTMLESKIAEDPGVGSQINCVISHPTLPVTITAHEDRHIRFFDNNTGKLLHSMVAHLDAVTSLAVDPNGLYLLSGSHDCSIRLWNLDSKTCVQEITSHRKKFEESIHDVAFHPSKPYIASAGADALAKVFV